MKKALNSAIDYLQAKFPPNRIVVLLTPLVFVPAAGFVCTWVAQQIPSANLNPAEITAVFVAGGLAALLKAYKWLDGWQKQESEGRV